jgi:hypothetical protein
VDLRVVESLMHGDYLSVDDLDFMEHREGIEPSNTGFAVEQYLLFSVTHRNL